MRQRQRSSAVSDVIASQAERQRKRNESSFMNTTKMTRKKKEMVTKITSRNVSTFQTQSQRRLRLQQKQMNVALRRGVPTSTSTATKNLMIFKEACYNHCSHLQQKLQNHNVKRVQTVLEAAFPPALYEVM